MARLTIEVRPDALADLMGELAPEQLRQVLTALANRIEVREWMVLSEPAFHDWLADADLYGDDPAAGDVVLVRFPFTDLTATKAALVVLALGGRCRLALGAGLAALLPPWSPSRPC